MEDMSYALELVNGGYPILGKFHVAHPSDPTYLSWLNVRIDYSKLFLVSNPILLG